MTAKIGAKGEIENALHPFFPVQKWQMTAKQRGGRGRRKLLGKKQLGKKAVHGLENLRKEQVTAGYDAATKIFERRDRCDDWGRRSGRASRLRFLEKIVRRTSRSVRLQRMADSPLEKW